MMINWNKSCIGYCDSKCGHFKITPIKDNYQNGKITGYKVIYKDVYQGRRDTQKQAKILAEGLTQ